MYKKGIKKIEFSIQLCTKRVEMSQQQPRCEYHECCSKATSALVFNGEMIDWIDYCGKHFKQMFSAIDPDDCWDEETGDFVYLCQKCRVGLCCDDLRFENGKCESCNGYIEESEEDESTNS